ncbi:hypothetical protein DERP_013422 [Dermatophagoides pteronyssinus]|uniref:Uncharacterized protein n=1 Tax=Dermatophagoides pteronyssinus TaxID=6956 RepID=A0ABQ8JRF5_DERPT|nr:hypothetical protein DERP_013422 [Dermatophagoides pteronyssinus]
MAINTSDNDRFTKNRRKSRELRLPLIKTNIDNTFPNNANVAVMLYRIMRAICKFFDPISKFSMLNPFKSLSPSIKWLISSGALLY